MDVETISEYHEAIEVLQAREAIVQMEIALYPNLQNPSSREKIERKYRSIAYPQSMSKGEVLTTAQFARMLKDGK